MCVLSRLSRNNNHGASSLLSFIIFFHVYPSSTFRFLSTTSLLTFCRCFYHFPSDTVQVQSSLLRHDFAWVGTRIEFVLREGMFTNDFEVLHDGVIVNTSFSQPNLDIDWKTVINDTEKLSPSYYPLTFSSLRYPFLKISTQTQAALNLPKVDDKINGTASSLEFGYERDALILVSTINISPLFSHPNLRLLYDDGVSLSVWGM